MSDDRPDSRRPIAASPFEDLLAAALSAAEAGGDRAVDAFVASHPAHAAALRAALAELRGADLLHPRRAAGPGRFGEFVLREPLGAGGMGIVYRAEQTTLGREVALKVVRPELLFFDGARERFRREIDAVARLEHPAIVPILATGTTDGVPWYAMPRIHGRSADAVVAALAGRDPARLRGADLHAVLSPDAEPAGGVAALAGAWWQVVARLVHQAALGIAHAHARGVLHRDLKPSNLMLTADGRAIVLDFGLAVARGDAQLTRTGTAAGSPAFMAPEQVRGERADERTDVYGLAAVLHCLLGLRAPFTADDPQSLQTRILAGTRGALPRDAAPAELRLVLGHAIDPDAARRYHDAAAFAGDLQAVLDGRAIAARGLPVPVRLQRFARRRRALATALAAAVLFVLVVPSALLWQQHRANERLSDQVRRSDHAASVTADAIEDLLAAVARDRMLYVPGAQDVAAEMLQAAIARFDQLAADTSQVERVARLRVRALQRLADVEMARGRLDAALAAGQRAAAFFGDGELAGEPRLARGEARRIVAGLLVNLGRDGDARAVIAASRDDLDTLAAAPEWRARVSSNLGALHAHAAVMAARASDFAAQERAFRDAARCYEAAGDGTALVCAHTQLAGVLLQRGRHDEALLVADVALAGATSAELAAHAWPTARHLEASARAMRGRVLQHTKRFAEAAAELLRAVTIFDTFLHDHPAEPSARRARGIVCHTLGMIHIGHGQWAAARSWLERACGDQLAVLARLPRQDEAVDCLGRHRRMLAWCLQELGDFAALEPLARSVGSMPGSPLLPLCGANGLMRCALAAPDRAGALREEALALWLESARRGRALNFADAVFAPLHGDPRVAALRAR